MIGLYAEEQATMMSDFQIFAQAVNANFDRMANKFRLFVTEHPADRMDGMKKGDTIRANYLAAFPEGTNPIFRTNTEHDCTCCKSFIKHLGTLIAFDDDGNKLTVWDNMENMPYPYNVVAEALREIVLDSEVVTAFFTDTPIYGAQTTNELTEKGMIEWNHFWGVVPKKYVVTDPGTQRGKYDAECQVFSSGLMKLTPAAVNTVLEWMEQGILYRGDQYEDQLKAFKLLMLKAAQATEQEAFHLTHCEDRGAHIKNSLIGTCWKTCRKV